MDLNEEIEELNTIFRRHGERNWKLPKVWSKSGAAEIVRMYGGMGSINDLYICKVNGHIISEDLEFEVNQKIRGLLSNIYEKCVAY